MNTVYVPIATTGVDEHVNGVHELGNGGRCRLRHLANVLEPLLFVCVVFVAFEVGVWYSSWQKSVMIVQPPIATTKTSTVAAPPTTTPEPTMTTTKLTTSVAMASTTEYIHPWVNEFLPHTPHPANHVCIIGRTYEKHIRTGELWDALVSWKMQADPNFDLFILSTDDTMTPDIEAQYRSILNYFSRGTHPNRLIPNFPWSGGPTRDSRIHMLPEDVIGRHDRTWEGVQDRAFGLSDKVMLFLHELVTGAADKVSDSGACEWVLVTNMDNIYFSKLIQKLRTNVPNEVVLQSFAVIVAYGEVLSPSSPTIGNGWLGAQSFRLRHVFSWGVSYTGRYYGTPGGGWQFPPCVREASYQTDGGTWCMMHRKAADRYMMDNSIVGGSFEVDPRTGTNQNWGFLGPWSRNFRLDIEKGFAILGNLGGNSISPTAIETWPDGQPGES